ncbi:MAG: SAM-dependent methyltransferase [Trebonia sp.]
MAQDEVAQDEVAQDGVPLEGHWFQAGGEEPGEVPEFDVRSAHIARVYDYWLGGKDNFSVDREVGDQALEAYPGLAQSVRANRAFLARTVRYLAAEAGVRQFLDVGTGLPSANNTHEVAQAAAPDARIVYVDNDPMVLAHARALLTSTREGACGYLHADARDTAKIIEYASRLLDFSRPVAVMLIAVLQFIPDAEDPWAVARRLMEAVPAGSYLVVSHPTRDIETTQVSKFAQRYNAGAAEQATWRSQAEVARFFGGLRVLEPGVVLVPDWRPSTPEEAATHAALWGGVAAKD